MAFPGSEHLDKPGTLGPLPPPVGQHITLILSGLHGHFSNGHKSTQHKRHILICTQGQAGLIITNYHSLISRMQWQRLDTGKGQGEESVGS